MRDEDADGRAPARPPEIGAPLDTLSLHEIDERVAALEAEIVRLREARRRKEASREVAASVFRT